MSNLDKALQTTLDVSLSIVVRRTALRKIRTAKKSLELTNAVVKLIQNTKDESLQRECLKIAGDMAIYQASDVIFPVTQGKGMNSRYAVQALGKIGGSKAYHYLLNIDKDKDVNSYEAKRAMRDIERKDPNIKEMIKAEFDEVQQEIEELKASAINAINISQLAPESDSMDLVSDPIEIVSDSSFEHKQDQTSPKAAMTTDVENQKLRKSLDQMKNNFLASESLRAEQEDLFKQEQALRENLQKNLNQQQQSSSEDQSTAIEGLQKEILTLKTTLTQTNEAFRNEKKRWSQQNDELKRKANENKSKISDTSSTSSHLQEEALSKRIEGQQIIINKLQDELEKKMKSGSKKIRFKKEEEKSNNIGCIVGVIIAVAFFITCR
ncbi:hypothetical protein PQO03_01765 [Lentisphaera profundi]|uniref:Uncharacterized protein n=1 Tax=Lentisphaera profundi TaxID=1658616 RepID=A0ABY7VRM5_9BACT|nr:hypothetical protein [Lentisphaera profundi]WDE96692.1 hypothetical protein PQO03_01765 [Lentisphaera profundi]